MTQPNYLSAIQTIAKKPKFYVILYGPPGIGKSSLAARMSSGKVDVNDPKVEPDKKLGPQEISKQTKKTLFIIHPEEQGINELKSGSPEEYSGVGVMPPIPTWEALLSVNQWLASKSPEIDEVRSKYETVVYDSLTGFETIGTKFCAQEDFKGDYSSTGFFSYGKGPKTFATRYWTDFLRSISLVRANGFNIVLICHSQDNITTNAMGDDYYQRTLMLGKDDIPRTTAAAEHIILMDQKAVIDKENLKSKSVGEGMRLMYCSPAPAHVAKGKGLPSMISMGESPDETWSNLKPYLYK